MFKMGKRERKYEVDLTGKAIENCNGVREELKRVKCKTSEQGKKQQQHLTKSTQRKIIKEGREKKNCAHTHRYMGY